MRVLKTSSEAAEFAEEVRRSGKRLALVPTMGFLHDGHLSLMREGAHRADLIATTIFVNPTQFGPKEDLSRYPRDLEGDLEKCRSAGVGLVWAPPVAEVYPPGFQTSVDVSDVSQGLCGEKRPGHFRGVATVVTKLFCLLRPHVALFGEKDYQQLQVIKTLARDLNLGVEVIGMPTIREHDGLAMSSRNAYLSPDERKRAQAIFRGLNAAQKLAREGVRDGAALLAVVREELEAAQLREDYVALTDAETLRTLSSLESGKAARLLVAAFAGATRLIDNVGISLGTEGS